MRTLSLLLLVSVFAATPLIARQGERSGTAAKESGVGQPTLGAKAADPKRDGTRQPSAVDKGTGRWDFPIFIPGGKDVMRLPDKGPEPPPPPPGDDVDVPIVPPKPGTTPKPAPPTPPKQPPAKTTIVT